MISRQRSVTFRQWRLPDVIAGKTASALRGGQRGERFASVHLAGRCDRFDSRGPAHMRAAVSPRSGDWIVEFVNRARVQADPLIQGRAQSFLLPVCDCDQICKLKRELARQIDIGKNEIKSVAPSVLCNDRLTKLLTQ